MCTRGDGQKLYPMHGHPGINGPTNTACITSEPYLKQVGTVFSNPDRGFTCVTISSPVSWLTDFVIELRYTVNQIWVFV